MIGDVIPHPHHKMLAVALIVEQHVTRQCLVDIRGHKNTVLLNQIDSRGIGPALPAGPLPAVTQAGLHGSQTDLRGEESVRQAISLAPSLTVAPECFADGKSN